MDLTTYAYDELEFSLACLLYLRELENTNPSLSPFVEKVNATIGVHTDCTKAIVEAINFLQPTEDVYSFLGYDGRVRLGLLLQSIPIGV